MPHPNRSPSSPSLRDSSKPALDELRSPRSHSMPSSRPPLTRSYSIRSFSARRPRPSVASIADVFVGSLVLAGFCHEHSPRAHTFSTLSIRASEPNLRGLRQKSRQYNGVPPTQRHLDGSGFSVQQSRRRSWFSHALAPSEEDHSEHQELPSAIKEGNVTKNNYYVLPRLPEAPDSSSHQSLEDSFFDSISMDQRPPNSANKDLDHAKDMEGTTEISAASQVSPRFDERHRNAVSSVLERLMGESFDWIDALEVLAPSHTFVSKEADGTRDVMESPSVAKLVDALPSTEQHTEQYLFRLYRDLPTPGVAYLSKASRGRLLRRLAASTNRRQVDARRYLAVVDDMIAVGLPMSLSLWSSAIHMAGRSNNGRLSKRRLIRAIGLWQQMEHVAGIKADEVVFNILFEIAIKANQFVVADRLEEEMKSRGLSFSRMGRVSKIHSCGMRKDLAGIRDSFKEFVAAGDIVDTVVLNCLMASFLRAGDTKTAEQLYAQMLQAQVQENKRSSGSSLVDKHRPSLSPEFTYYRTKSRQLARILEKSKDLKNRLPSFHSGLQDSLPLTPDTRTFHIWLQHCVRVTGDLNLFMNVLKDMEKTYEVPPRHLVYLLLFEGFATNGRRRKNWWTAEKLRLTWVSFLQAVRDSRMRRNMPDHEHPSMVWDNPLRFVNPETGTIDSEAPNDPGGLYMHLPSTGSQSPSADTQSPSADTQSPSADSQTPLDASEESSVDHQKDAEEYVFEDEEFENEIDLGIEEIQFEHDSEGGLSGGSVYQLCKPRPLTLEEQHDPNRQQMEYLSHRLENGVFIGPRMIILILRAFGTCCGPNEVMEAWLQLEQMWVPSKRKADDVFAIKEVIDEQMSRSRKV